MLPVGCWGGLLGLEPVPGWFGVVPGVPWVVGPWVAGPGWDEEFGLLLLGVEELGEPLLDVCPDPVPVDVDGVVVGLPVDGDAVLGGVDWEGGFWFGAVVLGVCPGVLVRVPPDESVVLRGVVRSPGVDVAGLLRGVVPGVFRGVLPSPGVVLPGRWLGIRPSGVRPSPAPGVRPSGVEAGVLRGEVGLGVDAGPDPVVEGVPVEGFLAGPEPGFGLGADVLPPEPPGLWCPLGVAPPAEGAVGEVGIAEPPSGLPPELDGEESVVGVGAALD
ncbi:hypothetical protein [Streptomyces lanatus]|uniref:Uncharacterized protein n=1 Tax=Streptomyces lanatus TaxID=66900 RepID=A0ABV1Y887_9ACTN|nr:hypothetical protein [Streptomyces lanatus]